MVKVEFSPDGFKQLEAQLYDLQDSSLYTEADAVLLDYIDWVKEHVLLNTDQVSYLESLDPLFIASLASKASIAFRNRLPLNLVLLEDYNSPHSSEGRGKWFLDSSTITASNMPGEHVTASGELIYEFEYADKRLKS